MHELSIAISIIELATEELQRQGGGRIEAIHLKLGAHSGVVKEALLSAYELAAEQSALSGARLIIQEVPVTILCPHCKTEQPVVSIQEMRCAVCGAISGNLMNGRELEVTAMEICNEPAAAIG